MAIFLLPRGLHDGHRIGFGNVRELNDMGTLFRLALDRRARTVLPFELLGSGKYRVGV